MIEQLHEWKIDSEWTMESTHFRYYYMISADIKIDAVQKKIKAEFVNYMTKMFGKPGQRWGFRFERNFDQICLFFNNQEDAVIFRLTHG